MAMVVGEASRRRSKVEGHWSSHAKVTNRFGQVLGESVNGSKTAFDLGF